MRQEAIPREHRRAVMELSWRCQNRLHEKGRKLAARGKTRQKVQTALVRELSAFVWEVMRLTTPLPAGAPPFVRHVRQTVVAPPGTSRKSRAYVLKTK